MCTMVFSQTERLLKCNNINARMSTRLQMGRLLLLQPQLTVYWVVLFSYNKTGNILQAETSLECLTYAFSDAPVPIFNDKCHSPPFLTNCIAIMFSQCQHCSNGITTKAYVQHKPKSYSFQSL